MISNSVEVPNAGKILGCTLEDMFGLRNSENCSLDVGCGFQNAIKFAASTYGRCLWGKITVHCRRVCKQVSDSNADANTFENLRPSHRCCFHLNFKI